MGYYSYAYVAFFLLIGLNLVSAQTSQGFIVTSVSLSNILHPGQSASQTQWIVTASLNGGGQSLVGTLTNSSINYQGFTSMYPLQISATTNPEQALYLINNANPAPVYSFTSQTEYGAITRTGLLGLSVNVSSAQSCPSSYGSGTFYSEWDDVFSSSSLGAVFGSGQATPIRICIYQQPVGYASGISQVNQLFSSIFTVTSNGQTESLTISNNNQSATSPDGKVQINWDGSLITGTGVPEASQYMAISNNQQSQSWVPATASSYSSYEGQYSSTSSQLGSRTFTLTTSGNNYPSPCSAIATNISSSYLTNVGNCLTTNILQTILSQNNNYATALEQGTTIGG
jgi:hypothetical protein